MLISRRSRTLLVGCLVIVLCVVVTAAVIVGATNIPVSTALDGIYATITGRVRLGSTVAPVDLQIIREVRFPRAILGAVVGVGLAICGLIIQSLLRNPLGDPYILGISSGASTGAALVIVLGGANAFLSTMGITFGAFLGALSAIVIVSLLAVAGGRVTPTRIIFAGMAVNYLFSALTSLITLMAQTAAGAKSVMFWVLGSLGSASWQDVFVASGATLVAFMLFLLMGRRTDVINLGDDAARGLGTNPRLCRNLLFVIIAFTVAILVSLTGAIGFIGLVIPHLAKFLVGPTNRAALPVAAVLGAILVVVADTVSRIVIRPAELPIGILTALVGTPMLMVLVRRHAK